MKISEFVVKVSNPYFTSSKNIQGLSSELLGSSIRFAVKNKVFPLFYEGCARLGIRLPKEADLFMSEYERRREAQLQAAKLLLDICEKHDIELMFFKTFRPFNYVPDDIDILLRHRNKLDLLINLLKDGGYHLLKIGTPEITLRKIGNRTFVDIDIHTSMAAGHLVLLKAEGLWRNYTYKLVGDAYKMPTLSERYEVVREAAYSLLKDFTVSIPGLYLAINAFMKEDLSAIRRIAQEQNLLFHVGLFLEVAHFLAYKLFGSEAKSQLRYERKNAFMMSLRLVRADLYSRARVPYPYPLSAIASAYLSKMWTEIHRDRNLEALLQLIKQPSSKGMDILLKYLRERFP